MSDNPTIAVRLDVDTHLGQSHDDVARDIVRVYNASVPSSHRIIMLDSKWSLPLGSWRDGDGGWGKPTLTEREKGYLEAVRPDVPAAAARAPSRSSSRSSTAS